MVWRAAVLTVFGEPMRSPSPRFTVRVSRRRSKGPASAPAVSDPAAVLCWLLCRRSCARIRRHPPQLWGMSQHGSVLCMDRLFVPVRSGRGA